MNEASVDTKVQSLHFVDIEPKVIASVNNLRVINKTENLKKGKKSNLTIEKLMDMYYN